MNTGRLVGILLTIAGIVVAVLAGLWIATQVSTGQMRSDSAFVAAALAFIPVALLVGFGIYMYVQGSSQAEEESVMHKQRELLDIVKSRGQVSVNDLALEMNASVDSVKSMVHQLVGL